MATSTGRKTYNVGGVLLNQPFKIRRLGHFGFNVYKIDECLEFYRDFLGFKVSDENDFKANPDPKIQEWLKDVKSGKGYFMRYGTDHHAFVLFNADVMEKLSPSRGEGDVTINQITWQTGSLAEVVNGHKYFTERETPISRVGRDMPGSNWHVYVYDPDDNVVELRHY